MANVTMDLNELDKLRSDLKQAQETIVEKDKEIIEIKADKRTLKITHKERFKDVPLSGYHNSSVKNSLIKLYSNSSWYNTEFSVNTLIRNVLKEYNKETIEEIYTEYINYDDVIQNIREDVQKKFIQQISDLESDVFEANGKLRNFSLDKKKDIAKIEKTYQEQIEKLKEESEKTYQELLKEYEDFKEEKDTRTFEEKIKDLTEELEKIQEELKKEKSKKWYQKL